MKLDATTINIGFRFHFLKLVEPHYTNVAYGEKTFEVRKNDRDYRVGDYIEFRSYDPITQEYTGEAIIKRIRYLLDDPEYVKEGFVILGLGEPSDIFQFAEFAFQLRKGGGYDH